MLLSYFNPIYYSAKTVSKTASPVLMTDIFRNYKKYFDRVASNYNLTTYFIKGAPRPEALAYSIYNNTQLYWVLLMANNIFDPYHDWIKTQEACYASIAQEYPDPETVIMYHVDIKGEKYYNLVEDPANPGWWYDKGDIPRMHVQFRGALAAVNAYEASILENEVKRKIRIVAPTDIENFIADLIKEMERNSQ